MKIFIAAYLTFCAGTMVLQAVATDLLSICGTDNETCGELLREHAWHALTWPHYLLLT